MSLDDQGLFLDEPSAISLASGDRINPLDPKVTDIHISDIARSLARQCRYGGHTFGHLSVARHSLWVLEEANRLRHGWPSDKRSALYTAFDIPKLAMTALLHDAAEAYLGDLVRPLKHTTFGQGYLAAENTLEMVIALRFDTYWPLPAIVREWDTTVLMQRELKESDHGKAARWTWNSTPAEDEELFLLAYRQLVGERRGL